MAIEVINYSEYWSLANCERRWHYGFGLGHEEEGERRGLHVGTLCHIWADRWLAGLGCTLPTSWEDDINTGGKPGEVRTLHLADFEPEHVALATWLAGRYESHYGSQPPSSWNVISHEEWLKGKVGKRRLVGRTDGLIEIDGDLWLREVKSYGSKGRLKTVDIEPQPGVYFDLVEQNYGRRPVGLLFDGIYTYRWKPERPTQGVLIAERAMRDPEFQSIWSKKNQQTWAKAAQEAHPGVEREPSESFERVWSDRTDDQLDITRRQLESAMGRRRALLSVKRPIEPMANVGNACNSCGFRRRCWSELTGTDGDIDLGEGFDDPELDKYLEA